MAEGMTLKQQHGEVRKEVVGQLRADQLDANRLHALVDQRADAYRAFAHKFVDAAVDAHQTLTADQRGTLLNKLNRFLDE